MNVKRYDLAEQSLRQAKTLDPEASEFQYLREKVNARAKYRHI